jgi:hypothetical protein
MERYEDAMLAVLDERFRGARFVTRKSEFCGSEVTEDGFEYEVDCFWCMHEAPYNECRRHWRDDYIRQVNGGEVCGGKCFLFYPLDQFWDDFSNENAIDPETGEIFSI